MWGSEKLSNLPKVTELVSGKGRQLSTSCCQYSRPGLLPREMHSDCPGGFERGDFAWGTGEEAFGGRFVRMSRVSSVGEGKSFQVEEAAFAKVEKPQRKYVFQGGDKFGYGG